MRSTNTRMTAAICNDVFKVHGVIVAVLVDVDMFGTIEASC